LEGINKRRITAITPAQIEFGVIPRDHWFQPDWIDEERAQKGRDKLVADGIIYGGSVSYRNMCRFNSGVSQFQLARMFPNFRVVLFPSSSGAEISMVLAYRVGINSTLNLFLLSNLVLNRPDVHFHCDIHYDPFVFMENNNKTYCVSFSPFSAQSFDFYTLSIYNNDV
jgi:alpha 1,2-mannosyltransferase